MLYYKHITEIVKQEFTYRHRSNFFRGVHKMTDSFKLVLFDSIIFLYTTVYVFFFCIHTKETNLRKIFLRISK